MLQGFFLFLILRLQYMQSYIHAKLIQWTWCYHCTHFEDRFYTEEYCVIDEVKIFSLTQNIRNMQNIRLHKEKN